MRERNRNEHKAHLIQCGCLAQSLGDRTKTMKRNWPPELFFLLLKFRNSYKQNHGLRDLGPAKDPCVKYTNLCIEGNKRAMC